jgi:hypothetical protein
LVDSSLLVVLSLASESLLKGRTHLSLNLLSSVIATPMPCKTPRMCFMTSGGGADVTVDGSTAPWWTPMPKYWDEEGDGNADKGMVVVFVVVESCVVCGGVVCGWSEMVE